jgi:hypothetical protein
VPLYQNALERLYPGSNITEDGLLGVIRNVSGLHPLLHAVARVVVIEKKAAKARLNYIKKEKLALDAINDRLLPGIAEMSAELQVSRTPPNESVSGQSCSPEQEGEGDIGSDPVTMTEMGSTESVEVPVKVEQMDVEMDT